MDYGKELVLDAGWFQTGVAVTVLVVIGLLIWVASKKSELSYMQKERDNAVDRVTNHRMAWKSLDRLDPSIAEAFEYEAPEIDYWRSERDFEWMYKEPESNISVDKLCRLWPDLKAEKLAHESESRVRQAQKKLDKARSK